MHTSFPIITGSTVVALFLGIMGGACRHDLPNHCSNLEGDATCRENGQGEFCSVCVLDNDGCGDALPGVDCYFPGESTGESSGSGSSGTGSTMDTSSESGVEPSTDSGTATTTGGPCLADGDCMDAAAPYCDPAGGCVSCEELADPDGACAGTDPGNPLCVGGGCVACTEAEPGACSGMTPVCDDASNTCVACIEHDQCGVAACNFFTGACLPSDAVVSVGPGQMFATLNLAIASFEAGERGTIIVHQADYNNDAVTVDGGRVLALLANGNDLPRWTQGAGGSPQLTVADGTVLMEGIQMSGNANDLGLVVDGGQAWVDRGRIVQNTGGGVLAQNSAELVLRNCFVGGNAADVDAIALTDSTLDMLYTTAGGGSVIGGRTRALFCDGGASATVRNSILVSLDPMPEVECPGVVLTNSATEAETGPLDAVGWFGGYASGDFSLTMTGADIFRDIAQWQDGDPPTDIEGDLRPTVDATPDYAGGDVP